MVIPLPSVPMPDGPLPEECQPNVLRLKYSIIAMIFFACGRAVCAIALGAVSFDFFALLNIFLSIVMGTFLSKMINTFGASTSAWLRPFARYVQTVVRVGCNA